MRAAALSLTAVAAVVIGCVWACLPELEITPPAPPRPVCGDGVISPDAGETCDPGPDASPIALMACPPQPGCKVACSGSAFVDGVSNHCYYSTTTNNPGDAGATCESSGAHLVRFVSEAEVFLVAHFAGETYWVGLGDLGTPGDWFPLETTNEPGWTADCPGCFAHIAADASDLPFVPADSGAGHHCVEGYVASGGDGGVVPSWMAVFCVNKSLGLCEREPVGTRTVPCSAGAACFTVAQTQATKRYVLVGPSTASGAVQACGALGGALVVFQTREEREQVGYEIGTETVVDGGANEFWIGLSANASGAWSWDRDGGLAPLPWGLNQPMSAVPNARAYVLVAAGRIDSELASAQTSLAETHYAVCEIP